jgi:hypothetical protein
MIDALIQELEQEAQTTKRVLLRVPADKLAWKPHDKSMSLGQLALHVATCPGNVAEMSQMSPFEAPSFVQEPARAQRSSCRRSTRALRGRARFCARWTMRTWESCGA